MDRGLNSVGTRIYATQLLDKRKVYITPLIERFGTHYAIALYSPDHIKLTEEIVVLPSDSVPMGVAYKSEPGQKKVLVLAHRNPTVGIAEPGPYRLSNNDNINCINYVEFFEGDTKDTTHVQTIYEVAEKGFCVNSDGVLLIPGALSEGEIYR